MYSYLFPQKGKGGLIVNHITDLNYQYNDFVNIDSRGLIWISSIKEVYSYNGENWNSYPIQFDGNIQSNFFEISNGDIWTSSYKGLHFYDRKNDKFEAIQLIQEKDENIGYHIFYVDKSEKLWLKINKNIYTYQPRTKDFKWITNTNGVRFAVDTTENGAVQNIIACPWLLEPGFEIIEFVNSEEVIKNKFFNEKIFNEKIEINAANILPNQLVLLSTNFGIVFWDKKNPSRFEIISLNKNRNTPSRAAAIQNNEKLLIPYKHLGIWEFDFKKLKFDSELIFYDTKKPPIIRSIYLDKFNHVWVTDKNNQRISYFHLEQNQFIQPYRFLSNGDSKILSITRDNSGGIWCGSEKNGIMLFNDKLKLEKHFTKPTQSILQLSKDSLGNVWKSGNQEITFYDYKKKRWEKVISKTHINFFFLLHISNFKKIVSSSKGLFELINYQGIWSIKKMSIPQIKNDLNVFELFEGKNYFYIPYNSKGVLVFHKSPFKLQKQFLLNTKLYGIVEDSLRSRTWLATPNGLAYFNWAQNNTGIHFVNEVFNGESITTVNLDKKNNIWFTTNKELVKFNPETNEQFIFRQEEGFFNTSFSLYSNSTLINDKIWLCTNKGVLVFNPDSIKPYDFKSPIHVKTILVNNDIYNSEFNPNEIKTINLPYNQNIIEFELTVISYHLADYNKLRYRIIGYEDNWRDLKRGENLRLLQIPSGEYKLEMIGINANGIKGEPRIININIAYPFWQTWWFPLLILLGIICISLAIAHLYIRQKLKAQQIVMDKRLALNQQRNAIANDLHDDIGNDLSQIISMSDLALIKKQKEANRLLNEIADLATESVKNLRYTMWSLDEKNNALSTILFKLREYAHLFAKRHDLQLVLDFPNQIPEQDLEGKQRRELFLFFKEALNNIKKYAEASTIEIIMNISDSSLTIEIKDDGKGFNLAAQKGTGKGLLTMEERATHLNGQLVIKTAPQQGTCLTLNIPIS